MLSVANVFQNHMVLQRNKPLRIWGTAEPFASVQAVLGTECAAVRADADGVWALELPPREAGVNNHLHVESGGEQIDLIC